MMVETTTPPPKQPEAWMVIFGDQQQYRALILEQARAERYAVASHGVLRPLVFGDDDAPTT